MVWASHIFTGLSVGLLVYAIFQLRFAKLEDEYRRLNATQSVLFKLIAPLVQILAVYNEKIISDSYREKYKRKLVISGNPLHMIPSEFLGLQEISAVGGAFFGILLVITFKWNFLIILLIGLGGFCLPLLWLNETIARRKQAMFLALPFSMDLLTLVVEAGLTFTAAIEEVVDKGQPGPLRDEFGRMLQDLRLGVSVRDALKGMAERTDMFEMRSFSSALIQADTLGAPLGNALRSQSEIRRTERFQKAEKMAQEAPVRMLFPLLFFIFPAVFIILLVPIILKFMKEGM